MQSSRKEETKRFNTELTGIEIEQGLAINTGKKNIVVFLSFRRHNEKTDLTSFSWKLLKVSPH